ncbi:MAG: 4Fe-4S dicluster domain-containing protein [Pseudomonadota bacterium]|nr:4Fe-4S dicluster domain-containing protein [Pseudomonadota bacterium]
MGSFLEDVNKQINGVDLQNCYHCQKCSSGCPMAAAMDFKPNEIIRMVQMGQRDLLLRSSAIWLCASCETCVTRCPNAVDIPRMIDILREMSLDAGVVPHDREVIQFHESFLGTVKRGGRVNEPIMIATYKLKTGTYLKDVVVGLKMFLKGKLSLFSPRTKNRKSIRRIFSSTAKF